MVTLLSIHLKRLYPNWDIIQKHIEYHPEEIFVTDKYKKTPLHYLFLQRSKLPPLFLVKNVVTRYPEATTKQDNLQQTPFLLACWSNASIEILALLLEENLEAAWVPDIQMRYPVEILAGNWLCDHNRDKIELLLQAFPKCRSFKSSSSLYPSVNNSSPLLHIACASPTPLEIIEDLIEIYPDMITKEDEFGNLPLFYAVCNSNIDFEILELLLLHNRNALQIRNKQGALALHLAIENNAKHWKYIFQAYPNAVYLTHEQNCLLPFMIAASSVKCNDDDDDDERTVISFNTLYELLLLSPDLLKV